jgi:hypothetical protein
MYKYNDYAVTDKELLYEDIPAHTVKHTGECRYSSTDSEHPKQLCGPSKQPPVLTQKEAGKALEPVCEKNLSPCWESKPVSVLFYEGWANTNYKS